MILYPDEHSTPYVYLRELQEIIVSKVTFEEYLKRLRFRCHNPNDQDATSKTVRLSRETEHLKVVLIDGTALHGYSCGMEEDFDADGEPLGYDVAGFLADGVNGVLLLCDYQIESISQDGI